MDEPCSNHQECTLAIIENYKATLARIEQACDAASRDPSEITLVAVSKNRSSDQISTLYDLGVRDFGESRWQEAKEKVDRLPSDIRWHFIGTLQSNKAKAISQRFKVIHTLTSKRQLDEISKSESLADVLIEVNIAKESQKAGVLVNLLDELVDLVVKCNHIHFRGLMTIGPKTSDSETSRGFFRELNQLNKKFNGQWLSMGMSEDFDVAIMEGSTHVRIGSALFSGV